jgi:hypothetical protein
MVTGAHFDSAGHLILTKYDGTTADGGLVTASSTTQSGVVELATSTETITGTDAVRAVTPAGLLATKVLASNSVAESASLGSYPTGISTMSLSSGSGWSLNGGLGAVVTSTNNTSDRGQQTFYASAGGTQIPKAWMRTWHVSNGGGGWTGWREMGFMSYLDNTAFTQATAMSSYPLGHSRLYYTTANGGSWDFSGMAGEVLTYSDTSNFARQTFTQHVSGSSNYPEVWFRTSDSATGWSAWRKENFTPGAWVSYTPTWTTQTGLHLPSFGNATVDCRYFKVGRKVDVRFNIVFGSTTNFGSSVTGSDNWWFGLPTPFPAARNNDEGLGVLDFFQSATNLGFARVKLVSTTQIGLSIITSFSAGSLASGIGGDLDSISPFTFASGNTLKGTFSYETAA